MGLFDKITNAIGDDDGVGNDPSNETVETGGVFDIPEWAVKDRVNVEKRTGIIHEHYDVTEAQARAIAQTLKDHMESTDGYSQSSMQAELEDELDIGREQLKTIIWTERASIEMLDTVNGYLEDGEPDHVYKLSAPDDDRTHPITREAADEIEEQGGVPMKELARILIEKAEKYEEEGGTPERMEHWVPHERFRFTVVRHVDF